MTILSSKKKGSCVKKSAGDIDAGDHGGPLSHPMSLPHDQLQVCLKFELIFIIKHSIGYLTLFN